MKLKVFMRKTHKWLGLLIGIQVFFWVVGGVVMSSFPLTMVHGNHLRHETKPEPINVNELYPIAEVVNNSGLEITSTTTKAGFSGPQYQLIDIEEKAHFFNALTGKRMPELEEAQALDIVKGLYSGDAEVISSERITENTTEYRKRVPVWRIEYGDLESSTFYIAEDNGELMSVRGSIWRLFDFVWMLHIMDYDERTDFNNWLLILAAVLALLFSISGGYLVFKTFRRKDFKLG